MTSYLTDSELAACQVLHTEAPYLIGNVSEGFFSVARHYGGMTFQDCRYVYIPATDELVREDVHRFVEKLRKPKKARTRGKQGELL